MSTWISEVQTNIGRLHVYVSGSAVAASSSDDGSEDADADADAAASMLPPPPPPGSSSWPAVPTAWPTAAAYSVESDGRVLRVAFDRAAPAMIPLPVAVDAATVRAELCGDHVHVACSLARSPYLIPMHQYASERHPVPLSELRPMWWQRSALSCRGCAQPLLRLGTIARATRQPAHAWTGEIMESAICEECVQDLPELARTAVGAVLEWSERPLHASQPKIAVLDSVSVQIMRSALRAGSTAALPAAGGAAWLECVRCRAVVGRLEASPDPFARLFKFALAPPPQRVHAQAQAEAQPTPRSDGAEGSNGGGVLFGDYAVDSLVGSQLLHAVQEMGRFELDVWCARSSGDGGDSSGAESDGCALHLRVLSWNSKVATERLPLQPVIKVAFRVAAGDGGIAAADDDPREGLTLGRAQFDALVARLRASGEWSPPSRRDTPGEGDAVGYLLW